jgi:hypothetical protein
MVNLAEPRSRSQEAERYARDADLENKNVHDIMTDRKDIIRFRFISGPTSFIFPAQFSRSRMNAGRETLLGRDPPEKRPEL